MRSSSSEHVTCGVPETDIYEIGADQLMALGSSRISKLLVIRASNIHKALSKLAKRE
jgi:hypothetical protein